MGYLGARALLDRLPPFVRRVDSMLNFDMNGIGSGLTVYITPGADAIRSALAKADEKAKILGDVLEINTKNPSGSDYAPFVQKGIPILSFFSNNLFARIHVPADSIYQVNPDMMADLANEAFRTIRILADR
jgi:Zn-dependent M28 family amino/carboxypeptidase